MLLTLLSLSLLFWSTDLMLAVVDSSTLGSNLSKRSWIHSTAPYCCVVTDVLSKLQICSFELQGKHSNRLNCPPDSLKLLLSLCFPLHHVCSSQSRNLVLCLMSAQSSVAVAALSLTERDMIKHKLLLPSQVTVSQLPC